MTASTAKFSHTFSHLVNARAFIRFDIKSLGQGICKRIANATLLNCSPDDIGAEDKDVRSWSYGGHLQSMVGHPRMTLSGLSG
jgi:hypothetical protein